MTTYQASPIYDAAGDAIDPDSTTVYSFCAYCLTLQADCLAAPRGPICEGCLPILPPDEYESATGEEWQSEQDLCDHRWSEDNYCIRCGADGRS